MFSKFLTRVFRKNKREEFQHRMVMGRTGGTAMTEPVIFGRSNIEQLKNMSQEERKTMETIISNARVRMKIGESDGRT